MTEVLQKISPWLGLYPRGSQSWREYSILKPTAWVYRRSIGRKMQSGDCCSSDSKVKGYRMWGNYHSSMSKQIISGTENTFSGGNVWACIINIEANLYHRRRKQFTGRNEKSGIRLGWDSFRWRKSKNISNKHIFLLQVMQDTSVSSVWTSRESFLISETSGTAVTNVSSKVSLRVRGLWALSWREVGELK